MLLLTGATGRVGSALLRAPHGARRGRALPRARSPAARPTACGSRSPSATSPTRPRSATPCAASDRGPPGRVDPRPARGSIEELNGVATWRMVARPSGPAWSASSSSRRSAPRRSTRRVLRAKALAERGGRRVGLRDVVVPPLARSTRPASAAPAAAAGHGAARAFQPISADDVADCILAALDRPHGGARRYELAGPHELSWRAFAALARPAAARSACRRALLRPGCAPRALAGPAALLTWDEAEPDSLDDAPARHRRRRAPGRRPPRPLAAVLGALGARRAVRRPWPGPSIWAASWQQRPSPAGRPTSWTAVGRPSSPSRAAANRRLAGDVEERRVGREPPGPREGRPSGRGCSCPSRRSGPGRSARAGVITAS